MTVSFIPNNIESFVCVYPRNKFRQSYSCIYLTFMRFCPLDFNLYIVIYCFSALRAKYTENLIEN